MIVIVDLLNDFATQVFVELQTEATKHARDVALDDVKSRSEKPLKC